MPAMRMLLVLLMAVSGLFAADTLDIYFIDVEGGQATLFVSPEGESMLIDTGFPGNNGRDADRIAAVAKQAGLKHIDHLLITHYHGDHVGGVPEVAARIPIRNFIDHGQSLESGERPDALYAAYMAVRTKGKHMQVKPGDSVAFKGVDVRVLSAAGHTLKSPLRGAGQPNPACAATAASTEEIQKFEKLQPENPGSVGTLFTFGRFRMLDLGDLTWSRELELVCPNNPIGTVDVYLSTHHGMNVSGTPAVVHGVRPRVAIMNNGPKKGGTAAAWQIMRSAPGIEDIWQLHYSLTALDKGNAPESFIANMDEKCEGKFIKLSAQKDGSFTVTNSRNGNSKTYKAAR
jgi:competence protein ComEC